MTDADLLSCNHNIMIGFQTNTELALVALYVPFSTGLPSCINKGFSY